jgi:hypothetical protein
MAGKKRSAGAAFVASERQKTLFNGFKVEPKGQEEEPMFH